MRLLGFLTVLLSFACFTSPVQATDEFGSRFSADTPSALQDDPEKALAEIAPAAGDEEPVQETQIDKEATDKTNSEKSGG